MSNEKNGAGIAQNEQGAEAAPSATEAGVATSAEEAAANADAETSREEEAVADEEQPKDGGAPDGGQPTEEQPKDDGNAPDGGHTEGEQVKEGDADTPQSPSDRTPHNPQSAAMKEIFRRLRIYADISRRHTEQILAFASIPENTDDIKAWAFNLGQCRQLAKGIIDCHESLFATRRAAKPAQGGCDGSPAPAEGAQTVPEGHDAPKPHCNEPVVDGGSNTVSPEQPASEGCDGSPAASTTADSPAAPTAPYNGEPRKVDDGLKQGDDEGAHGMESLPVDKPYHGESRRIDDDGSIHYNRPLRGVMRSTAPQQFMDATTGMVVNHP